MITKEERERDLTICEAARRVGGAKYEASTGHAAERLPLYIADAAEMDHGIKTIERLVADATPHTERARGYVEGLAEALRILRGEP